MGNRAAREIEKLQCKGRFLEGEQATNFRALAARANYLALDRPDIAFSTKELCRWFASPSSESITALKRLVRYLIGKRRMVWKFEYQQNSHDNNTIKQYVDTDFAGCLRTRRSTSGSAALRGKHLIKHSSQTQSTVALSSGEAELSGICRGASIGLGLQSIARDLGFIFPLEILSDATAAIGICRRRGLGKIRHLHTADLWIQDRLRSKDFKLSKVLGADNPADILTKHVNRQCLEKHMRSLSIIEDHGRAPLSPTIDHV